MFDEFEDLLDLFSRIFLVVNLDTTKTDLSPDGTLVPSLEQEDPLRSIDAFENLAMSAPLKAAADEGRLKIYPVDLLRAASHRLQSEEGEENGEPARGQANFDAFLGDLTEYLNSTDYLVAFLGDSLRRATRLIGALRAVAEHESVDALRATADALDDTPVAELRRQIYSRIFGVRQRVLEGLQNRGELTPELASIRREVTLDQADLLVLARRPLEAGELFEAYLGLDRSGALGTSDSLHAKEAIVRSAVTKGGDRAAITSALGALGDAEGWDAARLKSARASLQDSSAAERLDAADAVRRAVEAGTAPDPSMWRSMVSSWAVPGEPSPPTRPRPSPVLRA